MYTIKFKLILCMLSYVYFSVLPNSDTLDPPVDTIIEWIEPLNENRPSSILQRTQGYWNSLV